MECVCNVIGVCVEVTVFRVCYFSIFPLFLLYQYFYCILLCILCAAAALWCNKR